MIVKKTIKISLIAPCGMNCGICRGYQREKNKCVGCREIDVNKPITRAKCKIKNCNELKKNNLKYCYQCEIFPCTRMKHCFHLAHKKRSPVNQGSLHPNHPSADMLPYLMIFLSWMQYPPHPRSVHLL